MRACVHACMCLWRGLKADRTKNGTVAAPESVPAHINL